MCPLNELWEIIDQIVLHLLCLLPWLSSQSGHIHKQNSQNNAHEHTLKLIVHCFRTNVKYLSVGISLLTLIYPSYLTYEITFSTIGRWCIIPHSLWSMPSGRAFFQKHHLLESISTPLKCQVLYFQIYCAFFFLSFISWRYPARTAGFCHTASLNVFIFTPNVRRVEIFWLRKTDSCSSAVHSILPSLKKNNSSHPLMIWERHLIFS